MELLAADPTGKILAGGQSLIPALSARTLSPSSLIDIMRCPGLDQISLAPARITIGAACTQSKIEWDAGIRGSVPLLSDALAWVAMPQVRSRGTVVGCLTQGNAGAEVPVVFLALDGDAEISALGLYYNGSNPTDLRGGYGPSDFDRTHVFNIDYHYELPKFFAASSVEGKIANGWGVQGLITLQSGQPYSVIDYSGAVDSIYYSINDGITNPIDNIDQNLAFSPFPVAQAPYGTSSTPTLASGCNESNPQNGFYFCPTGLGQVVKTIGSSRQIQMSLSLMF